MEKLICPRCGCKNGYKIFEDFKNWFNCPECSFQCRMCIYLEEMVKTVKNNFHERIIK